MNRLSGRASEISEYSVCMYLEALVQTSAAQRRGVLVMDTATKDISGRRPLFKTQSRRCYSSIDGSRIRLSSRLASIGHG
jgi:hypothetical protein